MAYEITVVLLYIQYSIKSKERFEHCVTAHPNAFPLTNLYAAALSFILNKPRTLSSKESSQFHTGQRSELY